MRLVHETKRYYLVIQSYRQHHEFVVSHSYILEQLVFTAPHEWVHLCLAYGIDCLPSHVVGLHQPLPTPWLGMAPGLSLPQLLLPTSPLQSRPPVSVHCSWSSHPDQVPIHPDQVPFPTGPYSLRSHTGLVYRIPLAQSADSPEASVHLAVSIWSNWSGPLACCCP